MFYPVYLGYLSAPAPLMPIEMYASIGLAAWTMYLRIQYIRTN